MAQHHREAPTARPGNLSFESINLHFLEIRRYTVMSCIFIHEIWILFVYRSRTSTVGYSAALCTRLRSRILFSGSTSKPFLDVFRSCVSWKYRKTRHGLIERTVDHNFVSQSMTFSSYCPKIQKAFLKLSPTVATEISLPLLVPSGKLVSPLSGSSAMDV